MAYLTSSHGLQVVQFEYGTSSANAAAPASTIFTADAHLHSAYPDHDYISRDNWESTAISMYLQDGSGNPTVNAFKARVFISLDAKVWHQWVEFDGPNITPIDMSFSFVKVVRDNTTAGTVKVIFRSHLTHTS